MAEVGEGVGELVVGFVEDSEVEPCGAEGGVDVEDVAEALAGLLAVEGVEELTVGLLEERGGALVRGVLCGAG